jgi:hypothetical protein
MLNVKGFVAGGVSGEKFLRRTRTLQPLHLALAPSRPLHSVIRPPAGPQAQRGVIIPLGGIA